MRPCSRGETTATVSIPSLRRSRFRCPHLSACQMPSRATPSPWPRALGLMGRKPVRSFEEVLWLTGALDERYTRAAVDILRAHMRAIRPDVVYSEFNLAAVIAARAEGIPCVGSGSQPTTPSYASNPRKSAGIRRLLREMGMPAPASSLTVLGGMAAPLHPKLPDPGTAGGGAVRLLRVSGRVARPHG